MTYLNLHITDGSVTGENVDPVVALDNNYDILDTKLTAMQGFQGGATVNLVGPDAGQEVTPADSTITRGQLWVADSVGTWHDSDVAETWGAWTNLTIAATAPLVVATSGNTPQYRFSTYGRVELRGQLKPNAGVLTLNVWKLLFDGVTATTSSLRAIANRPNSGNAIGATSRWFKTTASSVPAGPAGAQTNCTICVANDSTFTFLQIYYLFSDTSTTPANQTFNLDGCMWEAVGSAYAGTI